MLYLLEKYKLKPKTVLLGLSILMAVLTIISNLHRTILRPQTSLKIDYAVAVENDEAGMVIIDKNCKRLLFADAEGRLVNVLRIDGSEVPFDEAELVKAKDGRVFVAGYKCYDDSWYYRSEGIAEYDMSGNFVRKSYFREFPAEETVSYPTICKINVMEDGTLKVTGLRGKYLITSLSRPGVEPSVQIVEAADFLCRYLQLSGNDDAIVKSNAGLWYFFRNSITEFLPVSEQEARWLWLANYQLTPDEAGIIFDRGIFPRNNKLSRAVDHETGHKQLLHINYDNELARYDYVDKTNTVIKELPLSAGLLLRVFSFWLAAGYLLLIVLWLAGKILHHLYSGAAVLILSGYLKTALSLLFVAALITGFYTKVTYDHYRRESEQIVSFQLLQLEKLLRSHYKDVLDGVAAQGKKWCEVPENRERIIGLQDQLQYFVHACGKNNSYYVLLSFADGEKKEFYTLADTTGWSTAGEPNREALLPDSGRKEGTVFDENDSYDEYINNFKCFRTDNGRVFAVLETGCLTTNVLARQQKEALNNFFSLLAIFIGLYLIKLCLQSFIARFYYFRQEWQRDKGNAKGHLSGLLNFLYGTVIDLDAVLIIFVLREMMPELTVAELAAYSVWPVSFYIFGGTSFNVMFSRSFYRRFSERQVSAIGGILSLVAFALMFVAVSAKNIYLFLFGKLLAGVGFESLIYYLVMFNSMGIKDERLRFEANYEGMRFRGVSNVMTMLGGVYIAESFGYGFIYGIAFIASAILAAILFSIASDKPLLQKKPEAVGEKSAGVLLGLKSFFLTRPGIMSVATLLVPSMFIRTYDTYFFPLCGTEVSLSPIVITNCCVFAKALSIAFSDYFQAIKQQMSLWRNNILFLSFNALMLSFFLISPSLVWALLALMLISANYSLADIYSYISALSLKNGFEPAKMVMDFSLAIGIVMMLRGVFFSALVSVFNIYQSAAVTGGLCLILVLGYAWYTRKENF